jgi:hypothetical protein
MPIFIVDTISSFRMRYAVEAKTLEHAMDEVVMRESDSEFAELTQKYIGYHIVDGRELTNQQLNDMVDELSTDKTEMCSHWMGADYLINKVEYNEDTASE